MQQQMYNSPIVLVQKSAKGWSLIKWGIGMFCAGFVMVGVNVGLMMSGVNMPILGFAWQLLLLLFYWTWYAAYALVIVGIIMVFMGLLGVYRKVYVSIILQFLFVILTIICVLLYKMKEINFYIYSNFYPTLSIFIAIAIVSAPISIVLLTWGLNEIHKRNYMP